MFIFYDPLNLSNHRAKRKEDARVVLAEARNMAKARPLAVVTDGLRAYQHAIPKEFRTLKTP